MYMRCAYCDVRCENFPQAWVFKKEYSDMTTKDGCPDKRLSKIKQNVQVIWRLDKWYFHLEVKGMNVKMSLQLYFDLSYAQY